MLPGGTSGKNQPANAGFIRDVGSILGLGGSHSSVLAWRISMDRGGLQSMGVSKKVRQD